MKIKITITTLILLILVRFCSIAQVKPLSIGDQVPDLTIANVINYKKNAVKISDFKGKLLILDFGATWCSPCVALLTKTDSLQKVFADKVQFLPVTDQDQATAGTFLNRLKKMKQITVPSIINDRQLNALFVHRTIPFYVWIDGSGKVIATTEAGVITAENINKVLTGHPVTFPMSIGTKPRTIDNMKTLFIPGVPFVESDTANLTLQPVSPDDVLYQSIATKYMPNVAGQSANTPTHYLEINSSILSMYQFFFGITATPNTLAFWNKSRFKIELKDTSLINKITTDAIGQECDQWLQKNGYCYELVWKNIKKWEDKVAILHADLDRYFAKPLGIKAELQKRLVPSYVLVISGDTSKLQTTGSKAEEKHDAYFYHQKNMKISQFINQIGNLWQFKDRTITDETNIGRKVDLELECDMFSKDAVNKQLALYGLRFIESEREADVLVIEEK